MKYSTQMLFGNVQEDDSSEDEIDELFSQLLRVEPPPTLVADILASVARLSLPHVLDTRPLDTVERLVASAMQPYS
jgi:hypothetical protein